MTPRLVLYGRAGCHLCEEALEVLERLRGRFEFELLEVDIEADDGLHARYLERIPVLALDGEELFDGWIPERVLAERLARIEGE